VLPAFGLYSHIQANRRRSVILLIGLFFLVYAVAYAGALMMRGLGEGAYDSVEANLAGAWRDMFYVAPFATIGVLLWIVVAYWGHQKLIDMVTGAHDVTREDDPKLYRMLENLCISRGMTTPRLKIAETEALNAYASGLNEKQYAITLTRGVVDRLEDAEIEAIIAHELTHIRNEDVKMMVIAVVIAGVVSFFGEMMFRSMRFGGMRMGRGMGRGMGGGMGRSGGSGRGGGGGKGAIVVIAIAAVIILLAWLLAVVIRFAISRSREYLADAGAVELTKNPDAMISALLKISGRAEIEGAPSSVMEMCVENPRQGFTALLATHPSIEKRVEALVKQAGGRIPPPESLTLRQTPAEIAAAEEAKAVEAAPDGTRAPLPPGPWGGLPGGDALPGGGGGPWGGDGRNSPWGGGS
jgi:heat shock protein HtpX